ncbi:MAG: LysR substrate-binding domain-containing protein [Rubrivivax sp.]
MELRHLRYLVALAECRNFTRAAEQVHVTQSTLSHQVRQLEENLGYVLFDRSSRRITLTAAGSVFLQYAQAALREVDDGLVALRRQSDPLRRELRIGATNTINLGLIPECVVLFQARHPDARVLVEELSADVIRERLKGGELDLGIAYRPTEPDELAFQPLRSEEMVLAVGTSHPFASRQRLRMVELHGQRLVLLPRSFATRVMLDACFRAAGAEPVVCAEMNTLSPMLDLVSRSGAATIVGVNAVRADAALRTIPLVHPTPVRTPGILRSRQVVPTPAMRSFVTIVRNLAEARMAPPSQPRRRRTG